MDETTEARILRFERDNDPRYSSRWEPMTSLPGLDMDLRSLPTTPSLFSLSDRGRAIDRCRAEVIDRLSDIMKDNCRLYEATKGWTAWQLYSVEGLDIDLDAQIESATVVITRRRLVQAKSRAKHAFKRRVVFRGLRWRRE